MHLVGSETNRIIRTIKLQSSPTNVGMEPVYWNGTSEPALLFNGGWLWDLQKAQGGKLPGLPSPGGGDLHRMGFYHAISANVVGDRREEIITWDPTATEIYIYSPAPLDDSLAVSYRHGPRQYNPRLMD